MEVKEQIECNRLIGKVSAVKNKYGFIRHYPESEPRQDYFFHGSEVEGIPWYKLECGDVVSFTPKDDERGFKAVGIRLEQERHLIKKENDK